MEKRILLTILSATILTAGTITAQDDLPLLLSTVAGDGFSVNGEGRYGGDGGPATLSSLRYPSGIFLEKDGRLLVSDRYNNRLRRVGVDGTIETVLVMGRHRELFTVAILEPTGVTKDEAGNIYVADTANNRVRSLSRTGEIGVLAGSVQWTNQDPFYGDNGPATEASLNGPQSLALGVSDIIYIADSFNNRIRRVTAGGSISTLAGTADRGFAGDGGRASDAWLNNPTDVHVGPDAVYIADTLNNRVRKIDSHGIITTVAGNGKYGYDGDGIPATEASLKVPEGVFVDEAGDLYIADTGNHRIRKVGPNGLITTVVGTGQKGRSEDGVWSTEARLNGPVDIIAAPGNVLYIVDTGNHQIRLASPMEFWLSASPVNAAPAFGDTVRIDIKLQTLDGTATVPGRVDVSLGIIKGPGQLISDAVTAVDGTASAALVATDPGDISFWVYAPGGERRILELHVGDRIQRTSDFTGDGRVDFADFLELAAVFGARSGSALYEARFDLTGNGRIDFDDFLEFAEAFGK